MRFRFRVMTGLWDSGKRVFVSDWGACERMSDGLDVRITEDICVFQIVSLRF